MRLSRPYCTNRLGVMNMTSVTLYLSDYRILLGRVFFQKVLRWK